MKSTPTFTRRATAKLALLTLAATLLLPALADAAALGVSNNPGPGSTDDATPINVFANAKVTTNATQLAKIFLEYTPANVGTISLGVGTVVGTTNHLSVNATSEVNAESILQSAVFTPANNTFVVPVNVSFRLSVQDVLGTNSASTNVTVLSITPLNDAPTISPGASPTHTINDTNTTTPFTTATIADVDQGGAQSVTVGIALDDTAKGSLTNLGSFTTNGTGYTFTGTPAAATTAIRLLVFKPVPNRKVVGSNEVTSFSVTADDTFANPVTNTAFSVTSVSINDAPTLTGVTTNHLEVRTGQVAQPFDTLTLVDPDVATNFPAGEKLVWSVTLSGSQGQLELGGSPIGSSYTATNDAASATATLRGLTYRAPTLAISGTNTLTFTIAANDQHPGGSLSSNVLVDLYSIVTPPQLSGMESGQFVNDNTTIAPFHLVNIQSGNGNAITVRVSLSGVTNDARGTFINLGSFTALTSPTNVTVYEFTGTSEAATAAIRGLFFQPTPNRIAGSSSELSVFGITVIDGGLTIGPDLSTSVSVIPVNDAPIIVGSFAQQTINDNQTFPPFTPVTVADADEAGNQIVTCTVTLDLAVKGSFSAASLTASGFQTNGTGGYFYTSNSAAITTAIRQLVFVPTPNRVANGLNEIVTFNIGLNDAHGGNVVNSLTTLRVVAQSGGPFVNLPQPQPVSMPFSTNILPFTGVTVADPATNVSLTVQIVNAAQGSFSSNSLVTTGFTNRGGGVYTFAGTASNATVKLGQLTFTPAPALVSGTTVNFAISATNVLLNYVTTNHTVVLRATKREYIVTKLTDYDPVNGSLTDDQKSGTLRDAIARAGNNDHITFDIRSTVVGQPDYPATIRLVAPLVLDYNLTFDGPGADNLTINGDSDTNGVGDVQLFTVNATVVANRLAFTKGYASFAGGAFEVNASGDLILSYCAITDCTGDIWGGGVDVNEGSLQMDHCLVANNRTSDSLGGLGGGGVSIFTTWPCTITHTTFATNRQASAIGLGGGAIYAETSDAGELLTVNILNCTFRDNRDLANHGSAVRPNVGNTLVRVQNSLVADGQGKNLEADQSGTILSLGGNISDDGTTSIYSQGGAVTNNIVFHAFSDVRNIAASNLVSALAANGGSTRTYALLSNSVAVSHAVSNTVDNAFFPALATDQRGFHRDATPDSGAFERGANQRVVIQEISFDPSPATDEFIEFGVPRDSVAVDFTGCSVYVDGIFRHVFTSGLVPPGGALVLFSTNAANTATPPVNVPVAIATNNLQLDNSSGVITLLNPAGQIILSTEYVGTFACTDTNNNGFITATNQSVVRTPLFTGVLLPYQRVVAKEGGSTTNNFADPGYTVVHTPLAPGNAPPLAYADSAATDAHTALLGLTLRANDVDYDATDVLRITAVGPATNSVNAQTNVSALGAQVVVDNTPTTGATVSYNPLASAFIYSLPEGSNVVDTFYYSIRDYSNGVANAQSASELARATAKVTVAVVGVNAAPTPAPDSLASSARLTTPENVVLDFTTVTNILGNDTDPNTDDNSNTLAIVSINEVNGYVSNRVSITTALGATATLDIRFDRRETHITYDPTGSAILDALNSGQTTTDTFYYSIRDSHGAIGTSSISIQVTGVDDAPIANPNTFATDEDTTINIATAALIANATDVDNGHTLHVSAVTSPSTYGASVTLVGTNVIYNPTVSSNLNALANKEFAADTFTYTVQDEFGLTSNAVATVTVAGVNDHPIAAHDAWSTDEETKFTTNSPGVLWNDVEPDINLLPPDDAFRVIPATNVTAGGVVVAFKADGSFSYDPKGLFDYLKFGTNTTETVNYVVMDHSLSLANDDTFAVTATTTNNVLPVLANDSILSQTGGVFTLTGVTALSSGGTATLNASSNAIIYTPLAGYVGDETFTYTVADGLGWSDTAHVTVTLTASTLFAVTDNFTVARGTTNTLAVLLNDKLIPDTGATLTVTALGTPSLGGSVSINGSSPGNTIEYAPNPTQPTPFVEVVPYTVTSGDLVTQGTVNITVLDRTNTLVVKNDNFTVIAGSGNNPLNVLANDLILPGPNTNLVITSFTSNSVLGTVSLNAARTRLLYRPSSLVTNFAEPVITYTVSDNAGGSATASVLVNVVPSGFVAGDDTFVVVKNSTNTLPVMVNDVLLPNLGQTLFISGIGFTNNAPNHGGSVTINGPGTGLVYKPAANYVGSETFTYEIADGSPARAVGRVTVIVMDNSAALSNPDVFRVARDSANNALLVLPNDYTRPQTPGALRLTGLQTNGVHATVSLSGATTNNWVLYTPNLNFIGTDHFSYVFTDLLGNSATNLVAVTVGDLAPRDDRFNVLSDSVTNSLDVRANDFIYPDTNTVRAIVAVGAPDHGGSVATNSGASQIVYTPAASFVGTEHFTYTLKDDSTNLFTATATVVVSRRGSDRDTNSMTMTVIGVNDIPTIVGTADSALTDKQTVNPFVNITIGDLDEYNLQPQTATITMDHLDNEHLTSLGGFVEGPTGTFVMSGTPPAITTALRGIVLVPVENHIIVPTTNVTHLLLSVDDHYVTSPVTNLTSVAITAVNDAPTTAGAGNYAITDKQVVNPFPTIVIADVDDDALQSQTVEIFMDHADNQSLTNLGGFSQVSSNRFTMTGTPTNITTSLRGIVFVPTRNHIIVPTPVTTRLTLTVNDHFAPVVTNSSTTVQVTPINDPPTIAGTTTYAITDKQTVNPFGSTTIADVDDDALQVQTVTITLDHLDNQTLTNLGGFTNVSAGLFSMTATPTNLTTALRGIVLVPTANHIPVPTTVTTSLILTVNDGFAPTVTDSTTAVAITAVNDAPTFTGSTNSAITDKQTVRPFATTVVGDVDNDALQPLTVRIAMDHLDNGNLTSLGGFTQISTNTFQLYGTAAAITTALQGIIFVPVENHIIVPTTVTTHFTLTADDAYVAAPTTNLVNTAVTAVNDAPVITGTVAGLKVYSHSSIRPFVGVVITEVDDDKLQALRVTVTLDNSIKGNLSNLGGFVDQGGGVYSIGVSNGNVTAAIVTTAIRGLIFTPTTTTNRAPFGTNEITRFTIRVDDFFAPTVVDTNTTVAAINPLTARVTASDKTNAAQFGWAVATTRDLAIVGAPHDPTGTNSGSAYLYTRSLNGSNTWTQFKKLTPPDGHANDEFGTSVAINQTGDIVVVGARLTDDVVANSGSAYLFLRNQGGSNNWGFAKKLLGTNVVANDQFGTTVSLDGETVVVGAPLADIGLVGDAGVAVVFSQNQGGSNVWGQVKKLQSPTPAVQDHFGTAVAVSGTNIVVGVPQTDLGTVGDTGAAYVFAQDFGGASAWGQMKKLVTPTPEVGEAFGTTVAIAGTNLVVAAPFADAGAIGDSGVVYVFGQHFGTNNAWGQVKKLINPTPAVQDHFGSALALGDDKLIVGTQLADANGVDSGAAYVQAQNFGGVNNWGQVDRLLPATVGAADYFGCSVAVSHHTVVVGAYNGLDGTARPGTVFMFRLKFGNPPQVTAALADQTITGLTPLAYTIPANAFTDPDVEDTLTLSLDASLSPPGWLNFDATAGLFNGTPSSVGNYPAGVVATDYDGLTASNSFTIHVVSVPNVNSLLSLRAQMFGTEEVAIITLTGAANTKYKLQCCSSLIGTPVWVDVASSKSDGSGTIIFYDVTPPAPMFYRAVAQ